MTPDEPAGGRVRLRCPVRGCLRALAHHEGRYACEANHSFDIARSGYVNLLQATDRKSKTPGDSREAALARRRYLDAGNEAPVVDALAKVLGRCPDPLVLDIGCGEGFHMRALGCAGAGVDISTAAIELAARSDPSRLWIVANADRALPFADAQFDAVLSITSRRNSAEFRRVLAPDGIAVLVVPGADDLVELREAVLGRGEQRDRVARLEEEMAPGFRLLERHNVRHRTHLGADTLRDLLATTYRGARSSQQERVKEIAEMDVTIDRDVCVFRQGVAADERK